MIEGRLVGLRPLEPAEWEALWRWNSDPEVMRWMFDGYQQSLARYLERGRERTANTYGDVLFGVVTRDEDRLVGLVRLSGAEPETGRAELDVYIGERDCWGRGYATEATRLVCAYGFDAMRLHSIMLWVVTENAAARRVYDKVGFREDGRHRECFRRDGKWYDMYLMSLLEDELLA